MSKTTVTTLNPVTFPYRVTVEQLSRCHRILDEQTGTVFYQVESESDPDTEYRVEWRDGWKCTCKSGQVDFINVRHPSGVCKHVRWSICREIEYRHELRARAQAQQPALPFDEGEALYQSRERGRLAILDAQRMARECMPHCE
jgi:hypothetical protein